MKVDLYALYFLLQVQTISMPDSMSHLDNLAMVLSWHDELLQFVQFSPTLTKEENSKFQGLVLKYLHHFVSHHQDLPTNTLEEHCI